MSEKERPKPGQSREPGAQGAQEEEVLPGGLVTGADVENALRGADFPSTAKDLLERARRNGAEEQVLDRLSDLPDRRFTSLGDALRQLDMLS